MRRYLQAVAANTAGVVVHKTLFDAAGIDRSTATRFDALLQQVFVTDLVPAYSSNRLNRLVHCRPVPPPTRPAHVTAPAHDVPDAITGEEVLPAT